MPMTTEEELQSLVDIFAEENFPENPEAKARLEAVIYSSPELKAQLIKSMEEGSLVEIAALPQGTNAGADYSPTDKRIRLKLENFLVDSDSEKYKTIFQLGHEIQHGEVNQERSEVSQKKYDDFTTLYRSGTDYDITDILNSELEFNYKDEAMSMLAGWNAVVNALKAEGKEVTLAEMKNIGMGYDAYFFEEGPNDAEGSITYVMKDGLVLNEDLTVAMNDTNIHALEETYSKQSGDDARLGIHANGSYTDYYMSSSLGWMCQSHTTGWLERTDLTADQTPKLSVDFEHLGQGATPQSIQDAGMHINTTSGACTVYDVKDPDQPIIFHDQEKLVREANEAIIVANAAVAETKEAQAQARQAYTEANEALEAATLAQTQASAALAAVQQETDPEKAQERMTAVEALAAKADLKSAQAEAKTEIAEAKTLVAHEKLHELTVKTDEAERAVAVAGIARGALETIQADVIGLNLTQPVVSPQARDSVARTEDPSIDAAVDSTPAPTESKEAVYLLPDGSPLQPTGDKDLDDYFKAFCQGDKAAMDAAVETIEQSDFGQETCASDNALYQTVLEERALEQQQKALQAEMERQEQQAKMRQQQTDSPSKGQDLGR